MQDSDRYYQDILAPMYLLLPLRKWGSKWGDFHWAMSVFNHEKGAI